VVVATLTSGLTMRPVAYNDTTVAALTQQLAQVATTSAAAAKDGKTQQNAVGVLPAHIRNSVLGNPGLVLTIAEFA
jgi:hypothetical protein